MPSHYVVVRYLPDPIAGESINVGVIVFGEGRLLTRFTSWARARNFGHEDIGFLRDFAAEVEERQLDLQTEPFKWTAAAVSRLSETWKESIQFTEPRASLKDPESLLLEVQKLFLRSGTSKTRTAHDRRHLLRVGSDAVRSEVRRVLGARSSVALEREGLISGSKENHSFGLVVANGKPLIAAEAISFRISTEPLLRLERGALAWKLGDVRAKYAKLPLSLFVQPPRKKTELYESAKTLYHGGFGVELIEEDEIPKWAQRAVATLV